MQQKLTPEIIIAAIAGFEAQRIHLDSQIAELRSMLTGEKSTESVATPSETGKPRRKFSAASRRKMAAAQRARYAKLKQASEPTQELTAKPKRKMSAAGRKAISDATKKRWAVFKAARKAA